MNEMSKKRVGFVGCGTIGGYIIRALNDGGLATVDYVHERDAGKLAGTADGADFIADASDIAARDVDLVVETANADVMREIALDVLARRDFLPFTMTALADQDFQDAVRDQCRKYKTRLYIPHGGILGLDGINDGRRVIEAVTITTIKSPKSLGLSEPADGVIYDGPTRGACAQFPRNVNVHAAFALTGIGFDRQHSIVIADPKTDLMRHEIVVKGPGLDWKISISSQSLGGVTGAYTPESATNTVIRVLGGDYDIVLA